MAKKNAKKKAKKKAAAARQAAITEKRRAGRKALEDVKPLKKQAERKRQKVGTKVILSVSFAIVLLAAGMVFVDAQYKRNTTEPFRAIDQLTPVSQKDAGLNQMISDIRYAAEKAGASDIQLWEGPGGRAGAPALLLSITMPEDAQNQTKTYISQTLMLNSKTGQIESTTQESSVPGKEYLRLVIRDTLHQYQDEELGEDTEFQVLETKDGILAMAGSEVDEYLADLAVIAEENPDATGVQQYELLKQHYAGKKPDTVDTPHGLYWVTPHVIKRGDTEHEA